MTWPRRCPRSWQPVHVQAGDTSERLVLGHLRHIDADLARRVADGLGLAKLPAAPKAAVSPQDMPPSPALRLIDKTPPTLQGRAIGILVDDGSDARTVSALRKAATDAGATVKIVAPKVGGARLKGGRHLPADGKLDGMPSVIFDAVAVVLSQAAGEKLASEAAAVDWLRGHTGVRFTSGRAGAHVSLPTVLRGRWAGRVPAKRRVLACTIAWNALVPKARCCCR